jgi:hypothetical protein
VLNEVLGSLRGPVEGDADACALEHLPTLEVEGRREQGQDTVGQDAGIDRRGELLAENRELVAPEAGDRVEGPNRAS